MTAGTCRLAVPLIGVFVSPGSLRSLLQQAPGGDFQALCGGGIGDDPLLYFFPGRRGLRPPADSGRLLPRRRAPGRGSFPFPECLFPQRRAPQRPKRSVPVGPPTAGRPRRSTTFGLNKWRCLLLEGSLPEGASACHGLLPAGRRLPGEHA